ncbi:MAG: hypothetical protein R3F55_23865 [Alphaproteobacteria bacterium]
MRLGLFFFFVALACGFAGSASAQWAGGLEVCAGDDAKCQTPGTVALACLGSNETVGDPTLWKDTGDALRVLNGRWQMFYASTSQTYNCTNVLVQRGLGQGWSGGMRVCAGNDRSCQTPGQVPYACWQDGAAVGQPTVYQYTGDAIRVVSNQWRFFYSHNQQDYACAAVLVGPIPQGYGGQLRTCAGNDVSCQAPGAMPLLCDIRGTNFANPSDYVYTGRSMRVSGGQWQMAYPDQSQYSCRAVIVAMPFSSLPPSVPQQPTPPSVAGALPSGSVIIFDGPQCPAGYTYLGQIMQPGSPVFRMSYCRRQ